MSAKRAWLVLPDLLSIRLFVDTGIVTGLQRRLDGRVTAIFLVPREAAAEWTDRLPDLPVLDQDELTATRPRVTLVASCIRPQANTTAPPTGGR